MVEDLVTADRLAAGKEYLSALADLGFVPEGAMWSMRKGDAETLELSLFSSVVNRTGPSVVYDALFQAFDKALTPRTFDPWDVAVYAPGTNFYEGASRGAPSSTEVGMGTFVMGASTSVYDERDRLIDMRVEEVTRVTFLSWVYRFPRQKAPAIPQMRAWNKFERRVAEAA